MRIAVNTRFLLSRHLEGIGLYTLEVLKRLVRNLPEDEFIFFFDRPHDSKYLLADNVKAAVLPPPARHPLLWYLWFEWSLPPALKEHKAELFFSPDGYLSLNSDIPTILTVHDLAYLHYPRQIPFAARHYYRHFVPRYLKKATRILTVSEYTRQDILKHFHLPKGKISTTCNGIRQAFAKHPSLPEQEKTKTRKQYSQNKPYFLYVGALHPRKNVAGLIRAFDLFKEKSKAPHQLLLTGRKAWMTTEIERSLASAKYRSEIHFTGYLDENELPALYRAAFALVYVSFFEGFGVPLLEAMYSNIPIITANNSSLPEIAGPAALYAEATSPHSIAEAMLQIYKQKSLREKLVAAGQKQRKKFSWQRAAADVTRVIEKIRQE